MALVLRELKGKSASLPLLMVKLYRFFFEFLYLCTTTNFIFYGQEESV